MTISILSLIVASMASWEYMDVLAANADKFNYHKTIGNNYGPADWDKVSCSNKDTCVSIIVAVWYPLKHAISYW